MELFKPEIILEPISKEKFQELIEIGKCFGGVVKVVVDIEKEILSMNCELHCDCADQLIGNESEWENLWGANVYPSKGFIIYTSLINIRPQNNNNSDMVIREDIKEKMEKIINKLIFNK